MKLINWELSRKKENKKSASRDQLEQNEAENLLLDEIVALYMNT